MHLSGTYTVSAKLNPSTSVTVLGRLENANPSVHLKFTIGNLRPYAVITSPNLVCPLYVVGSNI